MSPPKIPESISLGTLYPESPVLHQEPELGATYKVQVRYPWPALGIFPVGS